MKMIRILSLTSIALCIFITSLSLSGCGGGGGGGGGDESKGEPESALTATITLPAQNVTIPTGSSYTFKGQATGGVSPYKYTWSFGGDAAIPTTQGAEVTATFNTAGSYTITLTVSDEKGTTASDTVIVTVEKPALTVAITSPSSNHTITAGQSISFSGTVSGGEAPYTFIWTFGDGASDIAGSDHCTVRFTRAGTFDVRFSASDKDSSSTDLVRIHVLAIVPDLTGLSWTVAEDNILNNGLTIGDITWEFNTINDSIVLSQDLVEGSSVVAGTPIDLVLSYGISSHDGVLTGVADSIWHMEHLSNVVNGQRWDGYSIFHEDYPNVQWADNRNTFISQTPDKLVEQVDIVVTETVGLFAEVKKNIDPDIYGKMTTSFISYSFSYHEEGNEDPTEIWFAKGTWELATENGKRFSGMVYMVQDNTNTEVRGCINGDISGTYNSNTTHPSVFQISTISVNGEEPYSLNVQSRNLGHVIPIAPNNTELQILPGLQFEGYGYYYVGDQQVNFGSILSAGTLYLLPELNAGAFIGIWGITGSEFILDGMNSGNILSFVSLRPSPLVEKMVNMPSLEGMSIEAAENILDYLFQRYLGITNYDHVYSEIIPVGRIVEQMTLPGEIISRTGSGVLTVSAPTNGWKSISCGYSHSLGIKADGTLWAWGSNESGQLGIGSDDDSYKRAPVQIGTDSWLAVSAGESHSLALKSDHTLWAWGNNDFGQLGIGSEYPESSDVPIQVSIQGITWKAIAAGGTHSLAITEEGDLWAWGYNERGQLGAGSDFSGDRSFDPVMISDSGGWTTLAAGYEHSLGIESGILYAWGDDSYGQLGIGDMGTEYEFFKALPTPVDAPSDVEWASISAGEYFSLGITTQNLLYTLYTWGINNLGQLGCSTQDYETSPVIVGPDWFIADCGYDHVIAVKNDGSLWAWGNNDHGQIGNGFIGVQNEPCQIGSLLITGPVSAGGYYSIAIEDDGIGSILTWGANDKGQLGDRTNLDVYIPSQI